MWNGLSVFVTILQGLLALVKWICSIVFWDRKTYKDIYEELEHARIKRKFSKLKKDRYDYKCLKGAKLLFILRDYFSREEAKKFIFACQEKGYISFKGSFDVNKKITIRKEDEFIEKITNSRKS